MNYCYDSIQKAKSNSKVYCERQQQFGALGEDIRQEDPNTLRICGHFQKLVSGIYTQLPAARLQNFSLEIVTTAVTLRPKAAMNYECKDNMQELAHGPQRNTYLKECFPYCCQGTQKALFLLSVKSELTIIL